MITAVRVRIDAPRVYQEFRDNRDFLEATTSKTSLNVEGAAVPVVVNSPVEAVMPLTCAKTSVVDRNRVTNGLVDKMGVDGFIKGVMTIEARIDVNRYREIVAAIARIDTLRTALPFRTQGMAAALAQMPWYYGPDPAPWYRDTCVRTGHGRDVTYHTPLVELWDIISFGTARNRPQRTPTEQEWSEAIQAGLNVDGDEDEGEVDDGEPDDDEEQPRRRRPRRRAPEMADVFYTVPQAYNISRDPLFLMWLFPAYGQSPGGASISGLSPYADNSVALYGDTVARLCLRRLVTGHVLEITTLGIRGPVRYCTPGGQCRIRLSIHELRRRGADIDMRGLAERLLELTYGTNQLVPQIPVSLFVASRRMEGWTWSRGTEPLWLI
ncbi:hypothetical protein GNI_122740 [Gregarina niphandrodes]|uniref:Uncharacterized protein n=1 Tax=Gregarina niphandrodes TaxID=110365 RepID=A0A023B2F6_GRENI|nr:hypothetical protein GNI_122740 [Gregarina niphandrodes]EZG52468.1 hypothetical protein GNI_122740 [Gregarina niphandrodes]|eukprot:XP_011131893.1 hypothetical protein GNI_122740 [Gregarina niphandrodes]